MTNLTKRGENTWMALILQAKTTEPGKNHNKKREGMQYETVTKNIENIKMPLSTEKKNIFLIFKNIVSPGICKEEYTGV